MKHQTHRRTSRQSMADQRLSEIERIAEATRNANCGAIAGSQQKPAEKRLRLVA